MERADPIEQEEDDSHEIDTRVSDLHEQTEKRVIETTKHGRDQNIVVVSDISEPNSSASIAKKASQNFFTLAGPDQIINPGAS